MPNFLKKIVYSRSSQRSSDTQVAASTIVKVPQISKILRHKSVRGLSVLAFELEVIGYTIALAYCLHKGLPLLAFGEYAFLLIQGSIVRVFTSIQEKAPATVLLGSVIGMMTNGTIMTQIALYHKPPAKKEKKVQ